MRCTINFCAECKCTLSRVTSEDKGPYARHTWGSLGRLIVGNFRVRKGTLFQGLKSVQCQTGSCRSRRDEIGPTILQISVSSHEVSQSAGRSKSLKIINIILPAVELGDTVPVYGSSCYFGFICKQVV